MDPLITSSLISAGSSLFGGLFGRGKAKAQGVDYQKLRRDAEAGGFNPLTALMAGGGQGYQREFNPALSSGSFIQEAIARGTDTYFDGVARRDAQADAIRDHNNKKDLIAYEASLRPQKTFGYDLTQQRPYSADVEYHGPEFAKPADQRPPQHPRDRSHEYIEVFDNMGKLTQIPKGVADRLDIKRYGQMIGEDYEAMYGETAGEVVSLPTVPEAYGFINRGSNNVSDSGGSLRRQYRKPDFLRNRGQGSENPYRKRN